MNDSIELPTNPFPAQPVATYIDHAPDTTPGGLFTSAELEALASRRFNPLAVLTAASLSSALDGFAAGLLMPAARLWEEIARRDETVATVKAKREEAVAMRPWHVAALEDTAEAHDHAAVLGAFYQRLRAAHATQRHTVGGMSLLVSQMMEAVSFGYAAHHLIWQPDPARGVSLPGGRTVPGLGVTCEYVPLEFFEARTGELRFLGLTLAFSGEVLAPDAWMVTSGPGLMRAGSILHYYKRLAQHDLINFSEKFGTPGLVVHTTAGKDSPEGKSAAGLARSLAGNYRGVVYGAAENRIEVVWPQGGTGGGDLPMTGVIDSCKRDLAALFLGADLSTLSRGGDSAGASLQGEEQARRERADCARISETLNASLDAVVLRWYFGEGVTPRARLVIDAPMHEDRALLGSLVQTLVAQGARVPVEAIATRLDVPLAREGQAVLSPGAGRG